MNEKFQGTFICGYKDKYLKYSLERCWFRKVAVVVSPPKSVR